MTAKTVLLFRAAIVVPMAVAFFLSTSIPRRLGIYRYLLDQNPGGRGSFPAYYPKGEAEWGFTFDDLYGDGPFDDDEKKKALYRNRLRGQTALVTGANSGTGYEVSLALARLGVKVEMACRNPIRCETAAASIRADPEVVRRARDDRGIEDPAAELAGSVTTHTVDLSSLASVKRFCEEFLLGNGDGDGNRPPLDMLFLNAGMPLNAPLEDGTNELSEDGIELTFATNVVGHHLLYRKLSHLLLPSSESEPKRPPPRIVLTSSAASYDVKYDYKVATSLERLNGDPTVGISHYAQSKLAQVLWARELTRRTTEGAAGRSAPYVNAAHPGVVATEIWKKNRFHDKFKQRIFHSMEGAVRPAMWTAEEGALTLLYLGTASADLEAGDVRGRYFHPQSMLVAEHQCVDRDPAATRILQERLWDFLDELVDDFLA